MADIFGIILYKNNEIDNSRLFGRTVFDWVKLSMGSHQSILVPFESENELDFLPTIKAVLNPKAEYTVVLYSNTPLLRTSTISDAVSELAATKGNVLMLTRGFVFKTDFLISCEKLFAPPRFYCDEEDFLTASDFVQLSLVSDLLRIRILKHHMRNGVFIRDMGTTFIDSNVNIAKGVEIHPFNVIKNDSVIDSGTVLYEGNVIDNCVIGADCLIGPYARLRPKSKLAKGVKVGNYVEVKNSLVGEGTKIMHLAYLGDATVGSECNIGCGVVVANYDGTKKHQTTIGNKVFVGSNANLIAPIILSDGCFVAAGSTLTDNVPPDMLAIARARQENKIRKPKH